MMVIPVLTFFNNKGGVGKTSLVYHVAWMLSDLGHRVLVCDLDPQANLTAALLPENRLVDIWEERRNSPINSSAKTIMQCLHPLTQMGDIRDPDLERIDTTLRLIPGDLALARFEDTLSTEWPRALADDTNQYRAFRILTAFSSIMQNGGQQMDANIIIIDVGPNLGAINRSALIATDKIIVPLGADLFSLQGLRNLGPTLDHWRQGWKQRRDIWQQPAPVLPLGGMLPIGYVVQQHSFRLNRPVKAYDKWVNRMPAEYARNLLGDDKGPYPPSPVQDKANALTTLKHYRSLVPMAQEARKPIFHLTTADGAFGGQATAVKAATEDFRHFAIKILKKMSI